MSTDPDTIPPVPTQYGSLDGTPPGNDGVGRPGRRRIKQLRRGSAPGNGAGPGPPTDPETDFADEQVPTGQESIPAATGRQAGNPPPPTSGPLTATSGPPRATSGPPSGNGTGGYGLPAGYGSFPVARGPIPAPGYPGGPGYPGAPGYGPEGTGPFGPPPLPAGRRSVRDRMDDRREARANEIPDGAEIYQQRRFRRDKLRVVRGRRSRRIVRRIDTWTVLKVSLLFYLCALVVVLISGVVLWNVSQAFNFTHDIEKSVKTLFGYNTFTLHPKPMFEYTALAGIVLSVVGTLVNLLVALVYNLIADVVGGIQIIVVTEDVS